MERDEAYLRAKRRVQNLKAFYLHFAVYVLVNLLLFFINIMTDPDSLWFFYPLGGWGIGVAIHGLTTFSSGIFGKGWEERKIKQYMDKDK